MTRWSVPTSRGPSARRARDKIERGDLVPLTGNVLRVAGCGVLRELLAARPLDFLPPESNTEARVNEILVGAGRAPLERQIDIGDEDWIGRIDLVDRRCDAVLEVQSELYHGSLLDQERDAEGKRRLEAAGCTFGEVIDFDVWHRPRR